MVHPTKRPLSQPASEKSCTITPSWTGRKQPVSLNSAFLPDEKWRNGNNLAALLSLSWWARQCCVAVLATPSLEERDFLHVTGRKHWKFLHWCLQFPASKALRRGYLKVPLGSTAALGYCHRGALEASMYLQRCGMGRMPWKQLQQRTLVKQPHTDWQCPPRI